MHVSAGDDVFFWVAKFVFFFPSILFPSKKNLQLENKTALNFGRTTRGLLRHGRSLNMAGLLVEIPFPPLIVLLSYFLGGNLAQWSFFFYVSPKKLGWVDL